MHRGDLSSIFELLESPGRPLSAQIDGSDGLADLVTQRARGAARRPQARVRHSGPACEAQRLEEQKNKMEPP